MTGAESNPLGGDAVEGMPSGTERFHRISVGTNNAIVGAIQEPQDRDWYITQLANGIYRVSIEGHGTGNNTLRGPALIVRQSDARESWRREADSTYGPSRWVSEFEIDESTSGSDIFHLEVWSIEGNTGTYTITLESPGATGEFKPGRVEHAGDGHTRHQRHAEGWRDADGHHLEGHGG